MISLPSCDTEQPTNGTEPAPLPGQHQPHQANGLEATLEATLENKLEDKLEDKLEGHLMTRGERITVAVGREVEMQVKVGSRTD